MVLSLGLGGLLEQARLAALSISCRPRQIDPADAWPAGRGAAWPGPAAAV
jgi:hypothetical protein